MSAVYRFWETFPDLVAPFNRLMLTLLVLVKQQNQCKFGGIGVESALMHTKPSSFPNRNHLPILGTLTYAKVSCCLTSRDQGNLFWSANPTGKK